MMKVRNPWNETCDILKTIMPIGNSASVRRKESSRNKGKCATQRMQSLAVGILWEHCLDVPRKEGVSYTCSIPENSEGPHVTAIHFSLCRHSSSGIIIARHASCGVTGSSCGNLASLQVPGLRSEHRLRSGTWKNGHDLLNCVLYKEDRFLWDLCKYMYCHEK